MAKSTLEEMNKLKEKELEKNKSVPEDESTEQKDSPTSVIDDVDTFVNSPSKDARKHKDPISTNKEPGTIN
ncbi:hypothetical protein EIM50_25385 [Pseudoxanthomonas sp. SGD-10]|nr:hypothetical protein EIM50_25385 [Pseudoxanthomonas sp. SGD-10]